MTITTSSSSFVPPLLSNETIETRLITGAHGSRASLTKCAVRYRSFLNATHAAAEQQATAEAIEESKQLLDTELQLYKVEFTKLALRVKAFQQDLQQVQQQSQDLTQKIAAKKVEVETLREEVKKSKQVWGYKEEYEALAKMANHRPSRAILEKRLLLAQKQMQVATLTEQSLQEELEMRQSQFHTLMQCMLDLKASVVVQEEEENSTSEGKDGDKEDGEEEGAIPMDTT